MEQKEIKNIISCLAEEKKRTSSEKEQREKKFEVRTRINAMQK